VALVHRLHLGDPWTYRFFPFELGYFLVGALAYRNRAKLDWFLPSKSGKYLSYAIALVFTVLSIAVPLATLVYPLTLGLLIPSMFRVTAADHVDRMIGELSYPFYIFHLTALTVMAGVKHYWWPSGPSSAWTGLILALVLSGIGLAIETRYIEPWRARFAENKAPGRTPRMESVA
jgi:peptidoglycan/LPS O-acetylase OafA/YrhL